MSVVYLKPEYYSRPQHRGRRQQTRRMRIFLGELRAGADAESAAVVAEIDVRAARHLAADEKRGIYDHVVAIKPAWSITWGEAR